MPWNRVLAAGVTVLIGVNFLILASADASYALNYAAALLLVLLLHIVLHEAGHALVASAAGFQVEEVVSGSGPRLLQTRLGGAEVELRLFPTGGSTNFGIRDPHRRLRHVGARFGLTVAAGPAATALLTFVLAEPILGGWSASTTLSNGAAKSFAAAELTRFFGVLLLFFNLIPLPGRDGAHLLQVLRSGPDDEWALEQRLRAASLTRSVQRYDTARAWRTIQDQPALLDNPYGRFAAAVALLYEEQPAGAHETLLPLVTTKLPEDLIRMIPYTLAVACLERDPSELGPETDRWIALTEQTRGEKDGLVYVARAMRATRSGNHEEALRLVGTGLSDRVKGDADAAAVAFLHQVRAEAHRHLGDLTAATRDIAHAHRRFPGHPMIERERDLIRQKGRVAAPAPA